MIISKASLNAVEITKADKSIPALDNVHIRADGTVIAASGSTVLGVSPLSEAWRSKVPLTESAMIGEGETISAETIREVIKSIPRDTLFEGTLENCDYSAGKFTLTDGKRHKTISARTYPRPYINYLDIFHRVGSAKVKHREAINLRRLVDLLNVIDKMFADSSKNLAVFMEFTEENDVVIRVCDVRGRQRCIGIIKAYSGVEGKWIDKDKWEVDLCGSGSVHSIKKIEKKKRVAGA